MRCRCKLLWLLWCGSVFAYLQLQWRGLSNVVLRHDLAEKPPPMSEVPHKDMLRAMVKNMHEISWKIFCEANPHLVFHGFTAKTGLRLKTILQAGQKLGIFGALQDFLWLFQITLLRFESFRINDRIDRRFFLQRNKQVTESWLLPIASASLCRWNRWNLQWPAVEDAAFVTVVSRQGRDVIYFRHHSFVRLGSELMQVSKGFEQFGNVKICWPEQLFRVCNWSSKNIYKKNPPNYIHERIPVFGSIGPKVLLVMDTNLGLANSVVVFFVCHPDLSLSEAKDVTLTENGPRFTMRSQPNLAHPWSRSSKQKSLVSMGIVEWCHAIYLTCAWLSCTDFDSCCPFTILPLVLSTMV